MAVELEQDRRVIDRTSSGSWVDSLESELAQIDLFEEGVATNWMVPEPSS